MKNNFIFSKVDVFGRQPISSSTIILLTCYSLLKHSEKHYEEYGKLDYNIVVLDSFRELVDKVRKEDNFFNSHIMIGNSIYTIDDLFKEYEALQKRVNEK